MLSPADQIAQLEYVIREQMAEIDQLRAEVAGLVDWIAGEKDALSALQAAYVDPRSTPTNKIRAAAHRLRAIQASLRDRRRRLQGEGSQHPTAHPRTTEGRVGGAGRPAEAATGSGRASVPDGPRRRPGGRGLRPGACGLSPATA